MKENMKEKIMNFVKNKKNLSICGGVFAAIVALVIVIVLVSSKSNKNDINNSTTLNANVDEKTSISKEDETTLNKEDETTLNKEDESTLEEDESATVEDLLDETTSKDLVDETTEISTNTQGQANQPQKNTQGQTNQPQKNTQGQANQPQKNTQGQANQQPTTTQQPTTLSWMDKYEQATIVSQAEAKAAITSGSTVYEACNTGLPSDPNPFTLLVPTTRYVAYQDANGNVKKANMKGYYAAWSGSRNPSFGCTYQESCDPEIYEPRRETWELANIGKLSNGYQQVGFYEKDSNWFNNCIVFYYYFD